LVHRHAIIAAAAGVPFPTGGRFRLDYRRSTCTNRSSAAVRRQRARNRAGL
jgi:hypothetical protein